MFHHALPAITTLLALLPNISLTDTPKKQQVDLELVLAADASGSVSSTLVRAQRLAFAKAFRHPHLQSALSSGPLGKVAVIYFEWAGEKEQTVVGPWTLIENTDDVAAFASKLERGRSKDDGGETSISGAMMYSGRLLDGNPYDGRRRVVDLAGNGKNSDGPPVSDGLRVLREYGATVNALVLPGRSLDRTGPYAILFEGYDAPLDDYFKSEVIGGPGAFVQEIDLDVGFAEAILRKLVLEVAWVAR